MSDNVILFAAVSAVSLPLPLSLSSSLGFETNGFPMVKETGSMHPHSHVLFAALLRQMMGEPPRSQLLG